MTTSYTSNYAKLASAGINILSCTDVARYDGMEYIFEYSWVDRMQANKLHWSKASYYTDSHDLEWVDDLIAQVRRARKELEV